jgi:hypothetical protein
MLSAAGWRALLEDLAHLDNDGLSRTFPRDARGQLALGETVLLARYEPAAPLARRRGAWLVARSPLRRSHPQVITL